MQTCAGLFNRDSSPPGTPEVYTLGTADNLIDGLWLADLEGWVPELTFVGTFIDDCMNSLSSGYFLFDYEDQKSLIPNIITLAGVTGALPIDKSLADTLKIPNTLELQFDLTREWRFHTPLSATREVYAKYLNQTTGLAMINPGYDHKMGVLHPPLTREPDMRLVDFVVKEKLFALYLNVGCIPGTREHALLNEITSRNTFPKVRTNYHNTTTNAH